MEHNTQHNIISDSMIEAAENIRKVEIADAKAIVDIYNYYVENTAVSFETETLTVNEMAERIKEISSKFPYFVYEKDGKILGYCYAHQWKERAAYSKTLETTIYITSGARQNNGKTIDRPLPQRGLSCANSLYHTRQRSKHKNAREFRLQASFGV